MKENLVSQNRSTCWGTPSSSAASDIVRKASGPFVTPARLVLKGALDTRLNDLRGAEPDNAARLDGGRLAGLGVTAHAGALGAHLEHAEARQLHRGSALQRLGHQIQRALHDVGASLARETHDLVDGFAKNGARQRASFHEFGPHRRLNISSLAWIN